MIDEKKLIEKIEKMFVPLSTPDGSESIDIAINGYNECLVDVLETIKEQPKVGEWIPCSERLPEIAGVYRVTCLYDDKVYRVKDDLFYSDRTWGYDNHHLNRKVIAWKPLEKPYEVKEND